MFRTRLTLLVVLLAGLISFLPDSSQAQATATIEPATAARFDFPLTIKSIMRGPELLGNAPSRVRWTDDSEWIYFQWLPGGGAWHDSGESYRVRVGGGEPEKVEDEAADSMAIHFSGGALSPDGRFRLTSAGGDLYLVERKGQRVTRLTETQGGESPAGFNLDGKAIFFTRDNNLFEMTLEGAGIRQLTDIREGSPPRDPSEAQGQRAFLEEQQVELFEHIRIRKAAQEEREAAREKAREGEPEPVFVPRGERVGGIIPSPTGD
ncbi:MAG: hypothetical protein KAJ42_17095, partial [Gemmatimonadetes bacterium]|nr:hypothetical protein [Gemmatimonadota bacterium]